MKIRSLIFLIIAIVFAAGLAAAQPDKKISFEATEYFDPFGILGTPVGYYEDFGTLFAPATNSPAIPICRAPRGAVLTYATPSGHRVSNP